MTTPDNDPLKNSSIYLAAFVLCLVAMVSIFIRATQTGHDHLPGGDKAWQLNWELRLHADRAGSIIHFAPPWDTHHLHLYSQHFEHFGLRMLRTKNIKGSRDIVAIVTEPGDLILNAEFNIHQSAVASPFKATKLPLPSLKDRELYLSGEDHVQVDSPVVTATLEHLKAQDLDHDALIKTIFKYVSERIGRDQKSRADDAETVLRQGKGNDLGRTRAMLALLRCARIPARLIAGFHLSERESTAPDFWVEVLTDERWQPYDPVNGYSGELPTTYLPVQRGGHQIFQVDEGTDIITLFEIRRETVPAGLFTSEQERISDILDLTRLPLEARTALGLLLLLPLGILATEIARVLIGVRTFGTFTPTLLALAAIFVDWITALIIFALVTLIGIGGRALMPGLALSRVPRLAIVFTLVALSMALSVSVMDYYDLNPGGLVVLLPIVILTTLVDRIYSVADEIGITIALIRLKWTLAIAFVVFLILLQEAWGQWILTYPEIHLITIALIILIGRYQGPSLSDSGYISWFVEPAKKKRKAPQAPTSPPSS